MQDFREKQLQGGRECQRERSLTNRRQFLTRLWRNGIAKKQAEKLFDNDPKLTKPQNLALRQEVKDIYKKLNG